jgi:hypothetical protein
MRANPQACQTFQSPFVTLRHPCASRRYWTIRCADGIRAASNQGFGRMKQFLLKLFTWWNSQTFGTQLWTWRFGELVDRKSVV